MTMALLTSGTDVFTKSSEYVGADTVVFGMILAFLSAATDDCIMLMKFLSTNSAISVLHLHPSVQKPANLTPTRISAFYYAGSYAGSIEPHELILCAQASWKNKCIMRALRKTSPRNKLPLRTTGWVPAGCWLCLSVVHTTSQPLVQALPAARAPQPPLHRRIHGRGTLGLHSHSLSLIWTPSGQESQSKNNT